MPRKSKTEQWLEDVAGRLGMALKTTGNGASMRKQSAAWCPRVVYGAGRGSQATDHRDLQAFLRAIAAAVRAVDEEAGR